MNSTSIFVAAFLAMAVGFSGCGPDKPSKNKRVVSRTVASHKKVRAPDKKPSVEGAVDEVDRAWNEPPTAGQSKVRMVLAAHEVPIKGRPSFMAPQFVLTANEMHESLHRDGDEPTGKKKVKRFNPNEAGRYVFELPNGRWQLQIAEVDDLYLPWNSPTLVFMGDDTRSVDVKLQLAKADKGL